jgi:zinc protease
MSKWKSELVALSLATLVSCGVVLKPPAPDRRLNVRTAGSTFDTDLGYRFGVLPEPGAKIVRLDVRYPVGAADDPPGKAGLAHLVEHLLFEVEIARGGLKTSVGAELSRLALSWNAHTNEDYTSYEVLLLPAALEDVFGLEVDRLAVGCAGITPEAFAREREVVRNELRQKQGAAGAALERLISDAVYPAGHHYRAVDSVDTVAKLELKDVCMFLSGPYQRGKAIVVASGAVDGPAMQRAAGRHLGRLGRRMPADRVEMAALAATPGTLRLRGDVESPTLIVTWPLPPASSRDGRLIELAWGLIASRLESFGFTYKWGHSAYSGLLGGVHAPVLAVGIALNSTSNLEEAKEAAERSVQFAFRETYGNGERDHPAWVETWQQQAESLLAIWETLGGRNEMFAEFLLYDHDSRYLVGRIDELVKASPGEARAVAEKWLSPTRARYILIEPARTLGSVDGKGRPGAPFKGGSVEHSIRVDGRIADRPLELPAAGLRLDLIRYQLDNGLKVMLWPHGQSPLVHGRLVVDSGTAHDPRGEEGLALLVGASDVHADSLLFARRELATRVDDLIWPLLVELRSPGSELSDEKKQYLRDRLRHTRLTLRTSYETELLAALYGKHHPYARPAMSADSLEGIHRDLVMKWAREHIVPRNTTLILAGQFDPQLIKRHIAYNVDQVSAGEDSVDRDAAPAERPLQQWIRGVDNRPSPTVEITVAFLGGRGLDEDHAKRLVLEEVLASQLTRLRAVHALTYGFSARFIPRRAGGEWRIFGDVDASRAGEAAREVLRALAEMRRSPEAYRSSFVLARQKVIESLLVSAADSRSVAGRLVEMARFDLDDGYYDDLASSVAALTLQPFHQFVLTEMDGRKQIFGAFGNAGAVDEAIAAASTP